MGIVVETPQSPEPDDLCQRSLALSQMSQLNVIEARSVVSVVFVIIKETTHELIKFQSALDERVRSDVGQGI